MASSAVLLLLILIAVAATHTAADAEGTPAARFWEAALPGSRMPESIADLVQKGTDQSPLDEHHSAALYLPTASNAYNTYDSQCGGAHPASRQAEELMRGFFFHEADMRVGGALTVFLPASDPASFLPRQAADRIPFGNLVDALDRFGIAPGSEEAARVGETVCRCRAAPLAGERKACATSLEGVVLSAKRMLATSRPVAAAASALPISGLPRRAYVVQAIRQLGSGRFVACHSRPYPYAVYACHMTEGSSQAYGVSIRGGGGLPTATAAVDMAALCHFDTSNWNPAHLAFKILRTHPGGLPVCHFLPYADLVFGEKQAANGA